VKCRLLSHGHTGQIYARKVLFNKMHAFEFPIMVNISESGLSLLFQTHPYVGVLTICFILLQGSEIKFALPTTASFGKYVSHVILPTCSSCNMFIDCDVRFSSYSYPLSRVRGILLPHHCRP